MLFSLLMAIGSQKASRAKVRKCLGLGEGRPRTPRVPPSRRVRSVASLRHSSGRRLILGNHAPRRLLHFQHVFIVYRTAPKNRLPVSLLSWRYKMNG